MRSDRCMQTRHAVTQKDEHKKKQTKKQNKQHPKKRVASPATSTMSPSLKRSNWKYPVTAC